MRNGAQAAKNGRPGNTAPQVETRNGALLRNWRPGNAAKLELKASSPFPRRSEKAMEEYQRSFEPRPPLQTSR